jgi:hypothetical protein
VHYEYQELLLNFKKEWMMHWALSPHHEDQIDTINAVMNLLSTFQKMYNN